MLPPCLSLDIPGRFHEIETDVGCCTDSDNDSVTMCRVMLFVLASVSTKRDVDVVVMQQW